MKPYKTIFIHFLAIALSVLVFSSCKKTHEYTLVNTKDDSATQTLIASDEFELNDEVGQAVNDALAATAISIVTSGGSTSGTGDILGTISGAVIDTGKINTGLIKIIYFGKNADQTKWRLGNLEIKHAVKNGKVIPWNTRGASATIKFTNYEVFFLKITNKALSLNGSCTVTNMSGGLLKNIANPALVPGDSLVEKISAQLSYTYDDNATAIKTWAWDCNQLRVFNGDTKNGKDTLITCTIKGDTTLNNIPNVASWGATRSDKQFYSSITNPVLKNISGTPFLSGPLSGRKVILGIAEPLTVTYGIDPQGSPASSGDDPYGYIISWSNTGGQPAQAVIKYY
jgi:hypothetical protein